MERSIYLEINNFKSYMGFQKVKLKGNFIVVNGPNGSGKSNFVDAIAFVMDIYTEGSKISKEDQKSVKMIVQNENQKNNFERMMTGSRNKYYINDSSVSQCDYREELKKYNINSRVNNCLIFQNSVETLLLKKPLERTVMFEEFSGSGIFKDQYNQLKRKLEKYESDQKDLMGLKKSLNQDIKNAKLCIEEAQTYAKLCEENKTTQLHLLLFNLFYNKQKIQYLDEKKLTYAEKLEEISREIFAKERQQEQLLSSCEEAKHKNIMEEETFRAVQLELKKLDDELIPIRAKKEHLQKQLDMYIKSYQHAKDLAKSVELNILDLEQALNKFQQEKQEYTEKYMEKYSKGDLELSDRQYATYEQLKESVASACAMNIENMGLSALERNYVMLKDSYEYEKMKLSRINLSIEHAQLQKKTNLECLKKWEDNVKDLKDRLKMEKELQAQLLSESKSSQEQSQTLRKQLEDMDKELNEIDTVQFESRKIAKQLMHEYSGVYNRLADLLKPIHERYDIAVIKVLNRNANAIVVDTAETAQQCIKYLRANKIGICKFLPLDRLKNYKIFESLRNINDPPNVKLMYDVIKFEPPEIEKAVLYAVGNTLVCDNQEDASKVAFEMASRHNCISLDGTYYNSSGLISGGSFNLEKKARTMWSTQRLNSLMETELTLITRLRDIEKKSVSESALSSVAARIDSLQSSLRYAEQDEKDARKKLAELESKINDLESQRTSQEVEVEKQREAMNQASELVDEIKLNNEKIEKDIFRDFCESVGISDIREYEIENRVYQEKLNDLDEQINRIQNLLEYERSRSIEDGQKYSERINDLEKSLATVTEQETQIKFLYDEVSKRLEIAQREYSESAKFLDDMKLKIMQNREELKRLNAELETLDGKLNEIDRELEQKIEENLALRKKAKVDGIPIRTTDVFNGSSTTDSETPNRRLEQSDNVDFSELPEDMINLSSELVIDEIRRKLEKEVEDRQERIDRLNPNFKATELLTTLKKKLTQTNVRFEETQKETKRAIVEFEDVKKQRLDKFMECFDTMSSNVNSIYQELMNDSTAQAYLIPENPEEPYLAGIRYDCMVPGKRYQPLEFLSGGEQVMAVLPLFFAMQRLPNVRTPFRVLDEIDAALDNVSSRKLIKFLTKDTETQSIVVSHKKEFSAKADTIVGISAKQMCSGPESVIFTLDLNLFRKKVNNDK